MNYHGEQNIRDYIQNNLNVVNNYVQQPFIWNNFINGHNHFWNDSLKYAHFNNAINQLPPSLDRDTVSNLFKQDLYLGFIAMLMWGGYGANVNTIQHLPTIAQIPPEDVVKKICNLKTLLEQNNLLQAYQSLLYKRSNYIKGMSLSFFTKLLFFLGEDNNTPFPLIYDNFLQRAHLAFLIADNNVDDYFKIDKQKRNFRFLHANGWDCYNDYLAKINTFPGIKDARNLEAALFGHNNDNSRNNPRTVINHFIDIYFNNLNNNQL